MLRVRRRRTPRCVAGRDTCHRRIPNDRIGLNSYGTPSLYYQTPGPTAQFYVPHNDHLQRAADGGMLLGIPFVMALVVFVLELRRRFREAPEDHSMHWVRAGAVVGLAAVALQDVLDFSLQIPGNTALFAILAAIAIHERRRSTMM